MESDLVITLIEELISTEPNVDTASRLQQIIIALGDTGDERALPALADCIYKFRSLERTWGPPDDNLKIMEGIASRAKAAIFKIRNAG